jgi:hypothetical protein
MKGTSGIRLEPTALPLIGMLGFRLDPPIVAGFFSYVWDTSGNEFVIKCTAKMHRLFVVAGCRLQVAGCRLQVAGCRLQVAGCMVMVYTVNSEMIYANNKKR